MPETSTADHLDAACAPRAGSAWQAERFASESLQAAAEEVRAHLVALRGGAPFLSPADTRTLLAWLEGGRDVASLCLALERAADARRKRRSRAPLNLRHARPYLEKAPPAAMAAEGRVAYAVGAHPFAAVAEEVAAQGGAEAIALATALRALPHADRDLLLRDALALARSFLRARWDRLPAEAREARLSAAQEELRAAGLDPEDPTSHSLAEELVRDGLRADWPALTAESLWRAACQ